MGLVNRNSHNSLRQGRIHKHLPPLLNTNDGFLCSEQQTELDGAKFFHCSQQFCVNARVVTENSCCYTTLPQVGNLVDHQSMARRPRQHYNSPAHSQTRLACGPSQRAAPCKTRTCQKWLEATEEHLFLLTHVE